MTTLLILLAIYLNVDGINGAATLKGVSAGLDVADKAIGVVDKGVDVLNKIDKTLTGKLNAHYEAVAKRPEALLKPGDIAAISKNMKSGTQVTFQNLRGFDGINEYQPPGWQYEVKSTKAAKEPDSELTPNYAYPFGVGNMLLSGCFLTNYTKGDPCYANKRFIKRCVDQIDSANFIGVGFDITNSYTSESRKKSVIQRVCANKAGFLGKDVPDNMNAYGVYDYSIRVQTFQTTDKYIEYLAKKSGTQKTSGIFQKQSSQWQKTSSVGSSWFLHDFGTGTGRGGSQSSSLGQKLGSLLQKQFGSTRLQSSKNYLAVLEADLKLYEIALDHSTPDDLSAVFMQDFTLLPTSYYHIGADIKLQDFIMRYGTHYVKSAKFGGKLNIFKSSASNSKMSQDEFAEVAQTEFSAMMSTLQSSYVQKHTKANFWGTGGQSSSKSQSSSGSQKENTKNSKTSTEAGNQFQARSEFVQTTIEAMGGDPGIAAAIMDFYSPAFKNTFTKWLQSIPTFPKPYDMTFGRLPELFDVSVNSLFTQGTSNAGCLGILKVDGNKKYFLQETKLTDANNITVTKTQRVYCKYGNNREEFMKDFKAKRLALETAITIFIQEGPLYTSSFQIQAGSKGCETDTINYITGTVHQAITWPNWEDMKRKTFKVIFQLPGIPGVAQDVELEVKYNNGLWYTTTPGNRFTIANSCPTAMGANTLPSATRYPVCVAGLNLLYDGSHGYFKFDNEFYKTEKSSTANLTRLYKDRFVARAEATNILKTLQENKIGEVPCNLKWTNSHRIDPLKPSSCIHFTAASAGDIFIVFSSIPKDYSTWYYLQMSPKGIAFYRAMKLENIITDRSAGTLGEKSLFETFFVCVSQGKGNDLKIMFGKAPEKRELGRVHAAYTFPQSNRDTVSFYTFGAGEETITIDDVRVVGNIPANLECSGGLRKQDGNCVYDCHEQCDGCYKAKDPRNCKACKKLKYYYGDKEFECVSTCPSAYEPNQQRVCTPCQAGYHKAALGNEKCEPCAVGTITHKPGLTTCTQCPKGHYQSLTGQAICHKCIVGTVAPSNGMTACSSCLAGTYQNKEGQQTCLQCEFGNKCPTPGLASGIACAIGEHNDQRGRTTCKSCPSGTRSTVKGSKTCGNACLRGTYKAASGCVKCEADAIAPNPGTDACEKCPTGQKANDGRTACEDINECSPNPCQNGAACTNLVGRYTCACLAGFSGTNCETDIDECVNSPCKNNAPCSNTPPGSYTCTCPLHYRNKNCDVRDGYWASWGTYGICSKTCDAGVRTRYRTCHSPANGGTPCPGAAIQTEECNKGLCPVNYDCNYVPYKDATYSARGKAVRQTGNLDNNACIRRCATLKKTTPSINGITVGIGRKQCYCNEGMSGYSNEPQLKSCFLTEKGVVQDEPDDRDGTDEKSPRKTTLSQIFSNISDQLENMLL